MNNDRFVVPSDSLNVMRSSDLIIQNVDKFDLRWKGIKNATQTNARFEISILFPVLKDYCVSQKE